jgi:large subunit ribosomal protein L31
LTIPRTPDEGTGLSRFQAGTINSALFKDGLKSPFLCVASAPDQATEPSSTILGNENKVAATSFCFILVLSPIELTLHTQNLCSIMKKGIHPENYRFVVFKDMSNGTSFLSSSTTPSRETVEWEDGNEYPLVKLEISNTSHPFYTGKNVLVDTAGRIEKFRKRYEKKPKS